MRSSNFLAGQRTVAPHPVSLGLLSPGCVCGTVTGHSHTARGSCSPGKGVGFRGGGGELLTRPGSFVVGGLSNHTTHPPKLVLLLPEQGPGGRRTP